MNQPLIRVALPPAPLASQQSFERAGLTWLVFRDPRQEHVSFLAQQYNFHPLHIDDILSRSQRPKIDDNPEQEYVFLVMHFPVYDEVTRLSKISEIDIFVGRTLRNHNPRRSAQAAAAAGTARRRPTDTC